MDVLLEILTYKTENKPMKKLTLLIFVALSTQALYGADSQTAATLPGTYTAKALVGRVLTPIRRYAQTKGLPGIVFIKNNPCQLSVSIDGRKKEDTGNANSILASKSLSIEDKKFTSNEGYTTFVVLELDGNYYTQDVPHTEIQRFIA